MLGGSFLSDVSSGGCVRQPGEHIEQLLAAVTLTGMLHGYRGTHYNASVSI